jgi:type I restriction enzyme S subunit
MARITPCLENGKIARFCAPEGSGVGHGSTEFIVIRGRPGVTHTDFAYYLTLWEGVRGYAISHMTGTSGRQRVPTDCLEHLTVPIPSLPEQRAIAHILGTLDDKIELNRRISETLEAMARALFKAWFVDFEPVRAKMEGRWQRGQSLPGLPAHLYDLFPARLVDSELGEIPEGWRVGTLPDLFDILEGPGLRNWQYRDEGIKFLNIRCISDGDVDIAKANCISREEFKEKYSHFALQEDDVVISTSGTLGRLAVVRDDHLPIMLNTSIIRFRGLGAVGLTYVWGFLQSVYFLGEMQALASGSVQLNFGPMHLRQISVIQPSEKVLYEFECAAQPLLRKSLTLRKQSRTLVALRDALLPKLISGELRVKNIEEMIWRIV